MIYSLLIFSGSIFAKIVSLFHKKTARFFSLRRGEIGRVSGYFKEIKGKRVIWFHSASAGEFEQAKPVIENLLPGGDYLIVASFFSSSGYDAGLKYDKINFCFNLPLDYKKNAVKLLDCINPFLLVYSKYDVWTNLTVEAHRRGVSSALISGTLPEKSLRHRWPFRLFFRRAYRLLSRIYAISDGDAERFRKIAGDKNGADIVAIGDTRFDRVRAVIDKAFLDYKKILVRERGVSYLIAGSTYKKSEKKLLGALRVLPVNSKIRLILVPHEIDPENIRRLRVLVGRMGFRPLLFTDESVPVALKENDVLIVDAYGILAFLYNEADIVFIGGSYKGSVHSVLEPAVFGKPVISGPCIGNSREAREMEKFGGLSVCKDENELAFAIGRFLSDNDLREETSGKVKDYFSRNLGASELIIRDMEQIFF